MEGIEKITGRILETTDREIQGILERTENELENIKTSFEAICASARQEILDGAEAEGRARAARAERAAALEHKKAVLKTKQDMLDAAYRRAEDALRELDEKRYEGLLCALVLRESRGGEALCFNARDRARLGKTVVVEANRRLEEAGRPAGLTLSQETRDMAGGVVLLDGRVEVNCSFEVLLREERERGALEVSKILFG